jgi:putative N-acetyltransferase (TIGR04045 family)
MIELVQVWGQDILPFFSPNVSAQIVSERWQLDAYHRLRRHIFAGEQGLFAGSDRDESDARATPIVALSHIAGMPDEVIGTVRIYPTDSGTWFGGRLGVSPPYRSRRVVGTALICAAVSTAHAWGCIRFLATIQLKNVRYFEQHHFSTIEPVEVCGQPHHLMEARLSAYPPRAAFADQPVDGRAAADLLRRAEAA